jgi:sialate O-acetylesterase
MVQSRLANPLFKALTRVGHSNYLDRLLARIASALVLIPLLAGSSLGAKVRVATLISDNAVLQRGQPIPIWGTADPGEAIRVDLEGHTAAAKAGADGRWRVDLPAMAAGGPFELTVTGDAAIKISNILIGEVWICSGQSNMEMALEGSDKAWGGVEGFEQVKASTAFPDIRQFRLQRALSNRPQAEATGAWVPASRETVGTFSAVAYHFAQRLQSTLKVPVGLIVTAWGGTPAEAWTRRETLLADPLLKPMVTDWDQSIADFPARLETFKKDLDAWTAAAEAAELAGKLVPEPPVFPKDPHSNYWRPSAIFNGMISPLLPTAFAGVIWYQGESNSSHARLYRTLFPAMIRDWRAAFGRGNFPFLYVQIAPFLPGGAEINHWAELREAQTMALAEPRTAMVVTLDVGNPFDVHPRDKKTVGIRLARAAEAVAYGLPTTYAGPLFSGMKATAGRVVLSFAHAADGLTAKGGPLRGFEVAGPDRVFHPVAAKIRGAQVILSLPKGLQPTSIRYGWADAPVCNLFNKAGLPASSFRTDDWLIP